MKFRMLLVALLLPLFCSCSNLMWTSKPLITKPTDHDFRFVGTWEAVPDAHFLDASRKDAINITRDDKTKTKYTVTIDSDPDRSEFAFTASRPSDESEHAIVQITMSGDDTKPHYYYGYALRKDDNLYIWTVQSDKLVKLIKEEELNSVIDRGGWATHITADSASLLEILAKNSGSLAAEQPTTYKLTIPPEPPQNKRGVLEERGV